MENAIPREAFSKYVDREIKLKFLCQLHPEGIIYRHHGFNNPDRIYKIDIGFFADGKVKAVNAPSVFNDVKITAENRVDSPFGDDLNFIDHVIVLEISTLQPVTIIKQGIVSNRRNKPPAIHVNRNADLVVIKIDHEKCNEVDPKALVIATYFR